jgi:hypothetical protein
MRAWRALRWGIAFTSGTGSSFLLAEWWHDGYRNRRPLIDGETPRCLLFHTRATARTWCETENAKWAKYPQGDTCRSWRVRPIRVVDSVAPVRRAK